MRFVRIFQNEKEHWINLDRVLLIMEESTGYKLWYGTGEEDYMFLSDEEFDHSVLPLLKKQDEENEKSGA